MYLSNYYFRCRVLEFKGSKSQKKILKRFNKFLSGKEISQVNDRKMSTGSGASDDLEEQGVEQFVESTIKPQDIDVNIIMKTEQPHETADKECEGRVLK